MKRKRYFVPTYVGDEGIVAYMGDESNALRFRLDYINRILNP